MFRIFKSLTIYTSANFLNQAIPFLLLPILTRVLTPGDYGIWAVFMGMVGIINVIIDMGTTNAVGRGYIDRDKKNFNFASYTSSAVFVNLTAFALFSVVMYVSRHFISRALSIPTGWLFLLPAIGFSAAVYAIPGQIFIFQRKALSFATFKISNTFLEIILSVLFVVVFRFGWQGRALGMSLDKFFFLIIGLFMLLRARLLTISINLAYIKDILHYGVPVVFHSLGIVAVAATDRFFLSRLAGLSDTGIYSVGYSIASVITFFIGAFSLTWLPILFEKLNNATDILLKKIVKIIYLYFMLTTLFALAVIIFAPFFLKLMVGKNYLGASQFIFWLGLAFAFHGMYVGVANLILYAKKTYFLSIVAVAIVSLNIILNYVLIKLNGPIGAAQATFFTCLVRFILVWYYSNRAYPMPWFSFMK